MDVLVVILALVLLTAVIFVIAAPLRAGRHPPEPELGAADGELHELEAQREAKYREIRDAELDFQTGKLSREDHAAIDAALRSEALDILNRLERCREELRAAREVPPREGQGEGSTPRGA